MFELIEVISSKQDHVEYLFELLKKKKFNISHEELPSFDDHSKFVKNHSYRKWYLLSINSKLAGSIYLTNSNIIGLNISSNKINDYVNAMQLIVKRHKPLPPVKSERSKYFLVNANPNNYCLINALKILNMNHIQNTYAFAESDQIKSDN